jgi:hypothetical protein
MISGKAYNATCLVGNWSEDRTAGGPAATSAAASAARVLPDSGFREFSTTQAQVPSAHSCRRQGLAPYSDCIVGYCSVVSLCFKRASVWRHHTFPPMHVNDTMGARQSCAKGLVIFCAPARCCAAAGDVGAIPGSLGSAARHAPEASCGGSFGRSSPHGSCFASAPHPTGPKHAH